MEHVVFFPAPDGAPAFRRVPSIKDAVRLVEHLRNVEGIPEVGVHALTEVPVSFRTYYRVELPGAEQPTGAEQPVASEQPVAVEPPAVAVEPVVALVPDQPTDEPADPQGTPDAPVAIEPPVQTDTEPVVDVPAPEPALAGNGHVSGGPKSLGFFA